MVAHYNGLLKNLARNYGADLAKPYRRLAKRFTEALFHGSGDEAVDFQFTRSGKQTTTTKPSMAFWPTSTGCTRRRAARRRGGGFGRS